MILKKVGNTKLLCEKKDGSEKWFKATSAVIKYVKNNFKPGDSVIADFNDETYIIEKVTGAKKETRKTRNGGGTYQEHMVERSVYASVATMVAGIKGVDTESVKEIVKDLFEQGISLVKGEGVSKEETEEEAGGEEPEEPEDGED